MIARTPNRLFPRKRMPAVGLSVPVALAVSATPAAATGPPGRAAHLQQALDAVVTAGAPGAVAVVRVGGRTLRLASGSSSLDPAVGMRTGLPSRIGGGLLRA